MGAIEISSVGKVYPNGTRALEDVNITIEDGEFVVLVVLQVVEKLLFKNGRLQDITENEIQTKL